MSASKNPKCVALIPARSGSKRVPDKNIRFLADHPLIAYSIVAAKASRVFTDIIVSTDSEKYAEISRYYGAHVPFLRPAEYARDLSPDIEWVQYTLERLRKEGLTFDCFSIIRPTSPFRLPLTIRRAWNAFLSENEIDSLRAVEKCSQHPGKMWIVRGNRMHPLLPFGTGTLPWHSSATQMLPVIHVQNASLEIAWSSVALEKQSIAGDAVLPFFTEGFEGFDVNHTNDWMLAEELIRTGKAILPNVHKTPYRMD